MITTWFLQLGPVIADFFLTLLPASPPSWLLAASTYTAVVVAHIQNYSVWIPWAQVVPLCIGLFSWWVLVFLVKLGLKIWSFVPLVGGTG